VIRDDTAITNQFEQAPAAMDDVIVENRVYYENITLNGQTVYYRITGSDTPASPAYPHSNIWGTDVYSLRSELANAAVHSGTLAAGEEGIIAVTIVAAPNEYLNSTKNGVTSRGSSYSANPDPATAITITPYTGDPYESLKNQFGVRPGLTPKDLRCYKGNEQVTMRFIVLGSAPDDPDNPESEQAIWYQKYEDHEDVNGRRIKEDAFFVNRYAHDSSLATAVVHAGILQDGETGLVDVTYQGRFEFDKDDLTVDTMQVNGVKPYKRGDNHSSVAPGGYTLRKVAEVSPYTFTAELSNNTDLSSLALYEGEFTPAFTSNTIAYNVPRSDELRQLVNLTPTAADPLATVEYSLDGGAFIPTPSGQVSDSFLLPAGTSVIRVKVTAPDGSTSKIYNLTVNFISDPTIREMTSIINILKILSGINIGGIDLETDINGDGKIGIEEAIDRYQGYQILSK